ncbi:MAG: hypothetical protein Q9225_000635 [Loekoesia sp. 1 TL-2023]
MGPPTPSVSSSKTEEGRVRNVESETGSTDQSRAAFTTNIAPKSEQDADRRRASAGSKTWYRGATWRRGSKATPVTQVAKESILAATDKASELFPNAQISTAHDAASSITSPSSYLSRSLNRLNKPPSAASSTPKSDVASGSSRNLHAVSQQPAASDVISAQDEVSASKQHDSKEKASSNQSPETDLLDTSALKKLENQESKAYMESLPWRGWFSRNGEATKPEPGKPPDVVPQFALDESGSPSRRRNSDPSAAASNQVKDTPPRSWLGLWAARSAKAGSADGAALTAAAGLDKPLSSSLPATPNTEDAPVASSTQSTFTAKIPGWAFWSRETHGNPTADARQAHKRELVLAESRSRVPMASPDSKATQADSGKRSLPMNSARKACAPNLPHAQARPDISSDVAQNSTRSKVAEGESLRANNNTRNLLLPPITNTYRPAPRYSLLESLSRWWQDGRSREKTCVKLLHNPPRIKRALAIGVHGYFPAPLIRTVLGQPTGTSVRFADGVADAVLSWTGAHGYECEVEKVALEGEGRILERVDMLWKLLLNWIDNVRRADFIMVACHSQGVPVAIMLIAKLIGFGCVQDAKIGVCAMAGVNLGPFIDFKSRWIGGSAGELFEFARPDSQVSKDYYAALTTAVNSGVRIAYIGSIDDQLVSLESHTPGSLYSGEGHSTIYEDPAVYFLAVQNALETSSVGEISPQKVRQGVPASQNPYILPFSLRGVLEEDFVRKELREETMELLRQFDEWKPSSKVLKDVKFRLEGVRSKL